MGRMRKLLIGFGVLLLSALSMIRLSDPGPVEALRLAYFDQLQQWQPRDFQDLPVSIVDIDELSLAEQGQWPWPRYKLAEMVDRLTQSGAAVVVFDVLFLEPDRLSPKILFNQPLYQELLGNIDPLDLPDNDQLFVDAMERGRVVLGVATRNSADTNPSSPKTGFVEIGNKPSEGFARTQGFSLPLEELSEAASGLGSINMSPFDTAERVRRVPLFWRDAAGQIMPSLSIEALRVALGEQSFVVRGDPELQGLSREVVAGSFQIPTEADASIWVRFRPDHPSVYHSAHRVLTAPLEELTGLFEGRIVLVGTSAAGLLDIRTTALGENVPGVSIHAQVIEQILLGEFLTRSDFIEGVELLIFMLLGGLILWVMSASGPVLSILVASAVGLLVTGASWFLFQERGILLDVTLPLFGGIVFFSAMTAFQYFVADREKKLIRKSFSHYVAPEVLQEIENSGHQIKLGGELRPIAVMFCDIRNFTALSETMEPTKLVSLLNNLFNVLSKEILRQKGTIDKFIGDSIMAFWNAPLDIDDYPRKACLAALSMREALKDFNASLEPRPEKDIGLAIGISMGTACVGNVGSFERFDYSAIGDTVNRASRIEASCRHVGYDILVSEDVANAAEGFAFLEAGNLLMKGISERQRTFILVGDKSLKESSEFQALFLEHRRMIIRLQAGQTHEVLQEDSYHQLIRFIDPELMSFMKHLPARIEDFK